MGEGESQMDSRELNCTNTDGLTTHNTQRTDSTQHMDGLELIYDFLHIDSSHSFSNGSPIFRLLVRSFEMLTSKSSIWSIARTFDGILRREKVDPER